MKKFFFTLVISLSVVFLCGMDVSGPQSGTWSSDDNPINLVGDVTIPVGENLNVEAGAEIIAAGNYKITVQGTIEINGTISDTVRFYGNNDLNWGGLRLEDESNMSFINYCRISNTDDDNDYAVHSVNSPVFINNSYFDDHRKAVGFSSISTTDPSAMEIRNSKISDCMHHGILINDNSNAIVDSCEITRCGLGTQYRGAIQLGLQSSAHDCSPVITNNWIHHNGKQGITMGNLFNYAGMNPTIENNIIEYNLTGVYFYSATGIVNNNKIRNNFISGNENSGAGVMLFGSSANGIFTNNELTGNFTGFYLDGGATANLGNLENASDQDDGYNWIHDNVSETDSVFSVYNRSNADVMAQNNLWDSSDEEEIAETIIDSNDNGAYGTVTFLPLGTMDLYPPMDVAVETNSDDDPWIMTLTITPPEEISMSDFLGYNIYVDGTFVEGPYNDVTYVLSDIGPAVSIEIGVSAQYEAGESDLAIEVVENLIFKMPVYSYSLADSTLMVYIIPQDPGSSTAFTGYQFYVEDSPVMVTTDLEVDLTDYCTYGESFTLSLSALYEGGYESVAYEEDITFVDVTDDVPEHSGVSCYPNPASLSSVGSNRGAAVVISFNIQERSDVELSIFNIQGKRVRTLISSNLERGYYDQSWDGLDDNNRSVGSGIYFYHLKTGDQNSAGKMVILK